MKLKFAVIGLAALGGVALVSGSASAMPNGIPQAGQIAKADTNAEQVRMVCNAWGRCWWRPNYYGAYAYYPHRPWGWHRWHRWHHWW